MNTRPTEMLTEMVDVLLSEYHVDVFDKRRIESVVIPRAALFNVCRGYYSASNLGKFLGRITPPVCTMSRITNHS